MKSEMQELIAAAAEMLKCAYIEGSGWELGERLRDAIIAARASEGGWIGVKGAREALVETMQWYCNDKNSENVGARHACDDCLAAFDDYVEESLPSPPLSVETPNEVSK